MGLHCDEDCKRAISSSSRSSVAREARIAANTRLEFEGARILVRAASGGLPNSESCTWEAKMLPRRSGLAELTELVAATIGFPGLALDSATGPKS